MFETANKKLHYVNESFIPNKLNLLTPEKIYLREQSPCDSFPLRLHTITFYSIEIKRQSFIYHLGVLIIDENITWNKHIELVENKISKNMVCYLGLHINYRSIAWASTIRTKLDKILKKQKHGVRIIYNKDKFAHSKS